MLELDDIQHFLLTRPRALAWMPPRGTRAADILLADSTVFSTLFGADDSLKPFWKNLVTAR